MGEAPTLADTDGNGKAGPDLDGADGEPETTVSGETTVDVEQPDADDGGADVDEATVDLSEDDLTDGSSLFSGVEDSEESGDGGASQSSDGGEEADGEDADGDDVLGDIAGGLDGNSGKMEESINEGVARLAVIGLTEEDFEGSSMDKEGLEEEFAETFGAFRLGYFGAQTIEKYVLQPADGDVNPAWGFAGGMLMACGVVAWMRPDGEERVAAIREAVEGIVGGDA